MAVSIYARAESFTDNFDRTDSAIVGNGWSQVTGAGSNAGLELHNGRVENRSTSRGEASGITRAFDFRTTTTVSVLFSQANGYGGGPQRYTHSIGIRGTADPGTGYRLVVARGSVADPISTVDLYDGATRVDIFTTSSYLFGEQVLLQATFHPDGSIVGIVSGGSQSASFSFPARVVQSQGDRLGVWIDPSDNRETPDIIFPSADNLTVISADDPFFADSFNRPDSGTISNGWSAFAGVSGMTISNARAQLASGSERGGMFRPFATTNEVMIEADLFGSGDRFVGALLTRNNGTWNHGYGFAVEQNPTNTFCEVVLMDNGSRYEHRQLTNLVTQAHVWAVLRPDGSITGCITSASATSAFSFPPRAIESGGSNFAYSVSDGTTEGIVDNITLYPRTQIASWHFFTDLLDQSGNGNHGAAFPTEGPAPQVLGDRLCLAFDGVDDGVAVPYHPSFMGIEGAFTIAAWVYQQQSDAGGPRIFEYGNEFRYRLTDLRSPWVEASGLSPRSASQGSPVPLNSWHHLATTYDGTTMRFYMDGVLQSTASVTGKIEVGTGAVTIGRHPTEPSNNPFKGGLAEMRLFNRALSAAEIADLRSSTASQGRRLSGKVTAAFPAPGRCAATVSSGTFSASAAADAFGNYSVANLADGASYNVGAYVDINRNGQPDAWEPSGAYAANPVVLASDRQNINITIAQMPVDADNDGMADGWEIENGLTVGANDAAFDREPDGLTNLEEYLLGSNPNQADSDSDGIPDIDELAAGTDPRNSDTDGDGLPDKWEIDHGLNPLANDADEDRDFDGLTNAEEYNALPRLDPNNPQTTPGVDDYAAVHGGDGLTRYFYDRNDRLIGANYADGLCIAYAYDGNGNLRRQVYSERDTDADGLPDVWEIHYGLATSAGSGGSGANGSSGDPDGDGWTNFQEWKAGTDPKDPRSHPDLATTPATSLRQTAPMARILPATASGGGLTSVGVKLWDAEGNVATPRLQYFAAAEWRDAQITKLDGVPCASPFAVKAEPGGSTHTLIWNTFAAFGATFVGDVFVRARADDFSAAGAWSEPVSYHVDINADSDNDGISDGWEMENGLDPLAPDSGGDIDRDGRSNLLEFALGTDPRAGSLTGGPVTSIEGDYLTLTVTRNPAADALLEFRISVSGDLVEWFADPGHVTIIEDTPTLLKARDNVPFAMAPHRFIRLEVTKP